MFFLCNCQLSHVDIPSMFCTNVPFGIRGTKNTQSATLRRKPAAFFIYSWSVDFTNLLCAKRKFAGTQYLEGKNAIQFHQHHYINFFVVKLLGSFRQISFPCTILVYLKKLLNLRAQKSGGNVYEIDAVVILKIRGRTKKMNNNNS